VDNAFVGFPNYWKHLFEDTAAIPLAHSTRGQPTNLVSTCSSAFALAIYPLITASHAALSPTTNEERGSAGYLDSPPRRTER
jgi:hypothetical protein